MLHKIPMSSCWYSKDDSDSYIPRLEQSVNLLGGLETVWSLELIEAGSKDVEDFHFDTGTQ